MSTIVHPNVTEFDQLLAGDQPVVVDFWAEWCMPCRMLAPVIEQLDQRYAGRVSVAKVNIDEQSELAARYQVRSIPTVIIFKNGKPMDTIVGLRPIDAYTKALDSLV